MGEIFKSILLKKQTLIEVVCEFVFSDDNEWDWTIPGVIYEEVKRDFPVKSQEKGFLINFEDKDGEVLTHNVEGRIEKMVFLSKDHSALIQVGPNIFSMPVKYVIDKAKESTPRLRLLPS